MKFAVLFLALLLGAAAGQKQPASSTQAMYDAAAKSADAKFRHIEQNAEHNPPDQTPTVLTERELNSYFAAGRVKLPTGVHRVEFTATPGIIDATASVDFDEITAEKRSSNPLLSLFRGVHDVHAIARAQGSGGKAEIHITRIELDGVTIPRAALEFFLDRYVRPKHPEVGLDTTFTLPSRIDMAIVGEHQLTLTQK
jgi:hypothetical protein